MNVSITYPLGAITLDIEAEVSPYYPARISGPLVYVPQRLGETT